MDISPGCPSCLFMGTDPITELSACSDMPLRPTLTSLCSLFQFYLIRHGGHNYASSTMVVLSYAWVVFSPTFSSVVVFCSAVEIFRPVCTGLQLRPACSSLVTYPAYSVLVTCSVGSALVPGSLSWFPVFWF